MPLRSFVAAFLSLGVISPARAVSLCRIMLHNWLINKGPAAPPGARFGRRQAPGAPLAALIWGKTSAGAPLGRYNTNEKYIFCIKSHFLPLRAPALARGSPSPTSKGRRGGWVPQAWLNGVGGLLSGGCQRRWRALQHPHWRPMPFRRHRRRCRAALPGHWLASPVVAWPPVTYQQTRVGGLGEKRRLSPSVFSSGVSRYYTLGFDLTRHQPPTYLSSCSFSGLS